MADPIRTRNHATRELRHTSSKASEYPQPIIANPCSKTAATARDTNGPKIPIHTTTAKNPVRGE
jgi:hypothetical protein